MSRPFYPRTISWAYTQQPTTSEVVPDVWVSNYLAKLHHWAALEEHLDRLAREFEARLEKVQRMQ